MKSRSASVERRAHFHDVRRNLQPHVRRALRAEKAVYALEQGAGRLSGPPSGMGLSCGQQKRSGMMRAGDRPCRH